MAEPVGLRERKRLATRRSIQMAVLELIRDKGLERVTIEEVSFRADISPRTFFNYFPSKEAAAVGDALELPPSAAVNEFVAGNWGSGIIGDLSHLLIIAVNTDLEEMSMLADRRRILRQYPSLFAMRMLSLHRFEDEITEVVRRRLACDSGAEPEGHDISGARLGHDAESDRARLITLVAFGVLRHAWAKWAESDGSVTIAARIEASFAGLTELIDETRPAASIR